MNTQVTEVESTEITTKEGTELFGEDGKPIEAAFIKPQSEPKAVAAPVDHAFSFPLRGHSLNQVVDASATLIALMNRLHTLKSQPSLNRLHKQICNEIDSIELELHRAGYDRVSILAHRYCLCSAMDETVMSTSWGAETDWSERSLLATYHNETWGGEKLFIVLERLMMEPERYIDLIEFIYLLLCLGFEGKYKVMHNGRQKLEGVIQDVHDIIRKQRGDAPEQLLNISENLSPRPHMLSRQTPVGAVWTVAILTIGFLYLGFHASISQNTDRLIEQLRALL